MIQETNEERALADDLTAYINDKHTQEECIGFIDGYKAALAKLKNLRLADVVGQSEQLCDHPLSKRSYIGQNMLRCNKCGKEFS